MTRIKKRDLEVGMIVEDKFGRQMRVAALNTPSAISDGVLSIGPGMIGYGPVDWEPYSKYDTGISGVCGVGNIVRIVEGVDDE